MAQLNLETEEINVVLQSLYNINVPVRESAVVWSIIKKIQSQVNVAPQQSEAAGEEEKQMPLFKEESEKVFDPNNK